MVPLIHSRDEVVVSPVDPARVEVGDIVLTKVAGNTYVHLVKAIDPTNDEFKSATIEAASMDGPDSTGCTESPSRWLEQSGRERGQRSSSGTRRTR